MDLQKIRILVAIDFGTTHSSFAYVHIKNPETIIVNSTWPGREGVFKIPTALEYNETYTQVINWGDLALYDELDDTVDDLNKRSRPIELFKLHLSNLRKDQKPWLPPQLDYRKVIVDYFTQMQILIKSTLERRWPTISFPQQVGLILTIPAEWPPHNTTVMRECAYKAGLLTTLNSTHLEFTTEPEAIALCCLNVVKGHNLHYGVPALPITAVVRGAIIYGLNFKPTHDLSGEASSVHRIYDELDNLNKIKTISSRVFEKTYGIKATRKWNPSDPIERKLSDGMINIFLQIAKQGNEIPIDTGISMIFSSNFISRNSIDLFITDEHDVKYCDSPGVNLIGTLKISTPSTIKNSAISITLFFSNITIKVVAQEVDDKTGWKYETLFNNISY
ncbi:unnamed protein product [Rhizophagus irregularis]|nr:unnamed protein product [Rhizophagus irregularis]